MSDAYAKYMKRHDEAIEKAGKLYKWWLSSRPICPHCGGVDTFAERMAYKSLALWEAEKAAPPPKDASND